MFSLQNSDLHYINEKIVSQYSKSLASLLWGIYRSRGVLSVKCFSVRKSVTVSSMAFDNMFRYYTFQ